MTINKKPHPQSQTKNKEVFFFLRDPSCGFVDDFPREQINER
jgi:hypothetical protein